MEIPGFTNEEELRALEAGLSSDFWRVVTIHISQKTLTSAGVALSKTVEQREWTAGQATGLKEALNYPAERIRTLKALIKTKSIQEASKK